MSEILVKDKFEADVPKRKECWEIKLPYRVKLWSSSRIQIAWIYFKLQYTLNLKIAIKRDFTIKHSVGKMETVKILHQKVGEIVQGIRELLYIGPIQVQSQALFLSTDRSDT